mmetsp:Transcript_87683/g.234775  ORF Transcript_87683/g.234775 Transcript_87683/m.234775 type:complete len:402 (+) Transcript_87683:27-1232(+)
MSTRAVAEVPTGSSFMQVIRRHKKKVIAAIVTAVLGGVGFYFWRRYGRAARQLYALTTDETAQQQLVQQLAVRGQDEQRRNEVFQRVQQTADDFADNKVTRLQLAQKINSLFDPKGLMQQLKAASTQEEKRRLLKALIMRVVAKAVFAAYLLHLVLLLSRVQMNVAQRNISRSAGCDRTKWLRAVLGCVDTSITRALPQLQAFVLQATEESCAGDRLQPDQQHPEGLDGLCHHMQQLFGAICKGVDGLLGASPAGKTTANITEMLLPDDLAVDFEGLSQSESQLVNECLNETRDLLDSPQTLGVLSAINLPVLEGVVASCKERASAAQMEPRYARLLAPLLKAGEAVARPRDDTDETHIFERFSGAEAVKEFCQVVYYPDGPPQQTEDEMGALLQGLTGLI